MASGPDTLVQEGTSSTPKQNQPQTQRLLRVTLLAYRNPNLTEAEFHDYWTNVHARNVSAHLAKFGIVSYRQYHCPVALRKSFVKDIPSLGKGEDMDAGYDGFVELLMPSLECYEKALQDEYYVNVVSKDDQYFADMGKSKILVGWEEHYVVDGKVVNLSQDRSSSKQ